MKKTASIFSLFCGIAMVIVWAVLLATGQVTDLKSSPFQASFLLFAEFLTAIALIIGGFGLVKQKSWAIRTNLTATGMLLYCTVFSIGVFGQAGNVPAAGFFTLIAALAAVFSILFILETAHGGVQ